MGIKERNEIMNRNFETIGTFELTMPTIRVSDPCYEKGLCGSEILENCLTGTWEAGVDYQEKRVGALAIRHKTSGPQFSVFNNANYNSRVKSAPFFAAVDSGQCGFFDDVHYRDAMVCAGVKYPFEGDKSKDFGHPWYTLCSQITLDTEMAGVIPYGVVSSSGFGDGNYEVFVTRDRNGYINGAAILFICEDEDDFGDEETDN